MRLTSRCASLASDAVFPKRTHEQGPPAMDSGVELTVPKTSISKTSAGNHRPAGARTESGPTSRENSEADFKSTERLIGEGSTTAQKSVPPPGPSFREVLRRIPAETGGIALNLAVRVSFFFSDGLKAVSRIYPNYQEIGHKLAFSLFGQAETRPAGFWPGRNPARPPSWTLRPFRSESENANTNSQECRNQEFHNSSRISNLQILE